MLTDRRYDGRGRLEAVSNPYREGGNAVWTLYAYDGLGREVSVTTPDTLVTATVYDGLTTRTTVTTPQGDNRSGFVTVNVAGWTVCSDDPVGSWVVYDHFADGLMASATVNGDRKIYAHGSENFPRHYHDFESGLREILRNTDKAE